MTSAYAVWRRRVQCAVGPVLLALLLLASPSLMAQQVPAKARTVLVMGDSLSAAYGLSSAQGWVALTSQRVQQQKPGWRVVNASISGETTAGGAARVAAELKRHAPDVIVIELGANDGLRGLPLAQSRANLDKMITAAQTAKARVLLVGMQIPPNFGREYTQGFQAMFKTLADTHRTAFLPFLLEPVAGDRANFQDDNLHPVAAAQPKLRDHVWTQLGPLLK
jgi:acyl-CoA thioesterase I